MSKVLGAPVFGGTYVRCAQCKRRRKIANGGRAWIRRHAGRRLSCMPWTLDYEEDAA